MARDRANVWTDIWADSDWRTLSEHAQRLYLLLLTHPTLNYAGVADWRPPKLAPLSSSSTVAGLRAAAEELAEGKYIVFDDETEEVLIRSFVKHDGLLKSPNLVTAMSSAYGGIGSRRIREVLAFEVQKMHEREPDLKGWVKASTILTEPSVDVFAEGSADPSINPSANPSIKGLSNPSVNPSPTTTSTSTTTYVGANTHEEEGASGVPEEWKPNRRHYDYGKEIGVFVKDEAEKFRKDAAAKNRDLKNVNLAFTNWLKQLAPKGHHSTMSKSEAADRLRNPWKYQ